MAGVELTPLVAGDHKQPTPAKHQPAGGDIERRRLLASNSTGSASELLHAGGGKRELFTGKRDLEHQLRDEATFVARELRLSRLGEGIEAAVEEMARANASPQQ